MMITLKDIEDHNKDLNFWYDVYDESNEINNNEFKRLIRYFGIKSLHNPFYYLFPFLPHFYVGWYFILKKDNDIANYIYSYTTKQIEITLKYKMKSGHRMNGEYDGYQDYINYKKYDDSHVPFQDEGDYKIGYKKGWSDAKSDLIKNEIEEKERIRKEIELINIEFEFKKPRPKSDNND